MINKIFKYFIFSFIFLLFSGCSLKNELSKTTEKAMIKVDESTHNIETGYENTKFKIKKSYKNISDSMDEFSKDFYESGFAKIFISDKTILEKRKKLIIWEKGSFKSLYKIIKKHLQKDKSIVDPKGLDLSQKIKILNEYFYTLEEKRFIYKFSKKHPRPKVNEFKTDRQNIQTLNEYKFQLVLAKHKWELDQKKIEKRVIAKSLSILYGKPKVKEITYDPYREVIYINIVSSRNMFSQKISFKVEANIARKMKEHSYSLKPAFYYTIKNDTLNLIGASLKYKNKNYLAKLIKTMYQKKQNIRFKTKTLDIKSVDLDYKIISQNIKPPSWFYKLPKNGKTIGYGMGDSEQEAKNAAFREIVQQMGVEVSSEIDTDKRSDGSNFSSRTKQKVNVKTKEINLVGTKTIKSEKKDGIWFIAISK